MGRFRDGRGAPPPSDEDEDDLPPGMSGSGPGAGAGADDEDDPATAGGGGGDDPGAGGGGAGGEDDDPAEDAPAAGGSRMRKGAGMGDQNAGGNGGGGTEEQVAVVKADDFVSQLLGSVSGEITKAFEGLPKIVAKALEAPQVQTAISKAVQAEVKRQVQPVATVVKGMSETFDQFIDHVDDRFDAAGIKADEVKKALDGVNEGVAVIKGLGAGSAAAADLAARTTPAPATGGAAAPPGGTSGGTPALLDKGVQPGTAIAAATQPPADAGSRETVVKLIQEAEGVQERIGKAVGGLSDVTLAVSAGRMPAPHEVEALRSNLDAAKAGLNGAK